MVRTQQVRTSNLTRTTIMTTQHQVLWHGSQQESFDLINSIARNCTCDFGPMGVRLSTCSPHRMLMDDQRALDGLLFVRRMAERLRAEEWGTPTGHRAGSGERSPLDAWFPTMHPASRPATGS